MSLGALTPILETLLALAAVIALAYLILHKGLGAFIHKKQSRHLIQIKERVALDARRSICLVEVDHRRFMLGIAEQHISLIAELTHESTSSSNAPSQS